MLVSQAGVRSAFFKAEVPSNFFLNSSVTIDVSRISSNSVLSVLVPASRMITGYPPAGGTHLYTNSTLILLVVQESYLLLRLSTVVVNPPTVG